MHQRDYSESELEEIIDFEEEIAAYTSPRQRKLLIFIDDEVEEASFREFDLNYDDVTTHYSPLNDLLPKKCPSFFDVPQLNSREDKLYYFQLILIKY